MTVDALKPELGRRDFLNLSAGVVIAAGSAAAVWPLIDQMNPSTGVLASGSPLAVDLSSLEAGQQIVLRWRSMPIFVVRRTARILEDLKSPNLLDKLRDPGSENHQQPAYTKNWSRSLNPEYLVLVGVCTHLACIPQFSPKAGTLLADAPGGYLCHCHGSKYDLAGRVFKNVPAPYNLPVPPHHFPETHKLVLGENPPGHTFDLSEVAQL